MQHDIIAGMEYVKELTVTRELTAAVVGSGQIAVFATPSMILLMEQAAELAVINALPDGCATVGTLVNIEHAAATPVGMKVTATAVLKEIDGRKLVFDVEASDEREVIGRGVHERFIIQKDKFMARVNAK
jgi:predicted thioesterase